MPVIYAPVQLPPGIRYRMDDFMGLGGRYVDIFNYASPNSVCLGVHGSFEQCLQAAQSDGSAVVTTNVLAAYGMRDMNDAGCVDIYVIPAPTQYHALYFNLFPYLVSCAEARSGQLVLSPALVADLMIKLANLWKKEAGYLRNHQLFFHADYVRQQLPKIEKVRKSLSNQISKDAFTRLVYADPFDQFEYVIENLLEKIQYFDYLRPPPGGVVINCGVDNGWELPYFMATMGVGAHIYNIDPTGDDKLSNYAAHFCNTPLGRSLMSFHRQALWDSCGELKFLGYSVSEVSPGEPREGLHIVPAVTIDRFCEENAIERVDIIKMDLEGAEPRVLSGMKATVARHRPQLAICVYHSKEQSIEIPFTLVEELTDYNFYFDTYFFDTGESVFYAIPKEKDRRRQRPLVLQSVLAPA